MSKTKVDDIELHYREQGEAEQPALLLIHGLGCSLKYWACVFDAKELASYRIIALDLPGFGESDKPDTFDYKFEAQADITHKLMTRELDIPKFTLVGHSMGGAIAILLAKRHPGCLERLVVIEPNLKADEAQVSKKIINDYSETEFAEQYEDFKRRTVKTVQNWFADSHGAGLEEYIRELSKATPISMYRSARSLMAVTDGDGLVQVFQELSLPKVFLISEKTSKTRSLPESFQNSDVNTVIVDGVGHMMMVDNPRLFNEKLVSILPRKNV